MRTRKQYKLCLLVLGLFLFFSIHNSVYAGGLRVSPGAFCLQNAAIGKDTDLDIDMVITNKGNEEKVFVIKTLKPSEVKKKWIKGYTEIPDSNWLYFDKDRIKIGSEQEAKIGMHLNIPDRDGYYNQHWMVYVEVTTETKKGEMFKAAAMPNYMIETTAKENIKVRPHGKLGLASSIIKATLVVPGTKEKESFKIYNNDNVKHTYTFTSYIPKATKAKQDISGTPGYEWTGNTSWVKPVKKKMSLKPGEVEKASLNIFIPKGETCKDKGWESIVYIEPEKGLGSFVRVLIEPLK